MYEKMNLTAAQRMRNLTEAAVDYGVVVSNIDGLAKEASKRLGVPVKLVAKQSGAKLEISAAELVSKAGVFQAVFNKVYLYASNYSMSNDGSGWVELSLRWEHKSGGSNGTTLVHGWVNTSGEWKFRDL